MAVADGGIATAKIADDAVTAAKIAAGALIDAVYPVGAIFTTVTNYADSAAVVTAIGGTTWTAFGAGRVLVGLDSSDTDFDTVEETGGAKTITLDVTQIPAHTHDVQVTQRVTGDDAAGGSRVLTADRNITTSTLDITGMTAKTTGGGLAHDNVQPYIVVYMWKRTA